MPNMVIRHISKKTPAGRLEVVAATRAYRRRVPLKSGGQPARPPSAIEEEGGCPEPHPIFGVRTGGEAAGKRI